jgi:hypothetical protein
VTPAATAYKQEASKTVTKSGSRSMRVQTAAGSRCVPHVGHASAEPSRSTDLKRSLPSCPSASHCMMRVVHGISVQAGHQ